MPKWIESLLPHGAEKIADISIALVVLIVGWIGAHVVKSLVYSLLKRTTWDDKIAESFGFKTGGELGPRIERALADAAYYLTLAFVAVAFFSYLKIDAVTKPLTDMLGGFTSAVPRLLKAGLIGIVGFLFATLARKLIRGMLGKTGIEERMRKLTGGELDEDKDGDGKPDNALGDTLGEIVYWFILIITAVPVLEAAKIGSLSQPLSAAIQTVTIYLPKIGAAALLMLVGYVVAKIARTVVSGVLAKVGVDKIMTKLGFGAISEKQPVSGILGNVVMAFILLQAATSAVGRLGIEELAAPLNGMLDQIYAYMPKLMVGGTLMAVGALIARVVGTVCSRLLAAVGFNTLMVHIGIYNELTEEARAQENASRDIVDRRIQKKTPGFADSDDAPDSLFAKRDLRLTKTPADIAGVVISALVVLLFLRQVLDTMHLNGLAILVAGLLAYLPNVLVALVVMGAAMWAGNWSHKRIDGITEKSEDTLMKSLGSVAHVVVVVFGAMVSLQQLGVGRQLIAIAFAILLGAVALALALAFGLGGREVAAKIVKNQYDKRNGGRRLVGKKAVPLRGF